MKRLCRFKHLIKQCVLLKEIAKCAQLIINWFPYQSWRMNELSQGKSAGCRILYALTYIYIFLHAKIEQQNDAPLHSLFHYGGKKPHNFPLKIFFKLKKKNYSWTLILSSSPRRLKRMLKIIKFSAEVFSKAWYSFRAGVSEGWMTRDQCLILHSGLVLLWNI